MIDFKIVKAFNVIGKSNCAPSMKQVSWYPHPCSWIKFNIDEAVSGSPSLAAGGGIFRDSLAAILGCFAINLGITSSLHAGLQAAMVAIELAFKKGWRKLWLESDSLLVVLAFTAPEMVPWRL